MAKIKKHWYFGILIVFIILIIIFSSKSNARKHLKEYLLEAGFDTVYETEIQKVTGNEKEYDSSSNGSYNIEAFNFQEQRFNVVDKLKEDNKESVMTMSLSLVEGTYRGTFNIEHEYGEWYISSEYNLKTGEFSCNTMGYKGLNDYCDELETHMKDYLNVVDGYLSFSKTDKYYYDYMYK